MPVVTVADVVMEHVPIATGSRTQKGCRVLYIPVATNGTTIILIIQLPTKGRTPGAAADHAMRIGNYRVLFDVADKSTIIILDIFARKEGY